VTDKRCGRFWDEEEYRQMRYYEEQQREAHDNG